jgi:hypothetical protein
MTEKQNIGIMGQIEGYAGQIISLNLKKTPFFGLGDLPDDKLKIKLNVDNWYTRVPDNLTPSEINMLYKSLENETLVLGKRWIPAIEKQPDTLRKYERLLNDPSNSIDKIKETLRSLFRYGQEGNYTSLEIFRYIKDWEERHRNRTALLHFIQEGINNYSGPVSLVPDSPSDPGDYTVIVDRDKNVTPLEPDPRMRFKGLDDPEVRQQKLDAIL